MRLFFLLYRYLVLHLLPGLQEYNVVFQRFSKSHTLCGSYCCLITAGWWARCAFWLLNENIMEKIWKKLTISYGPRFIAVILYLCFTMSKYNRKNDRQEVFFLIVSFCFFYRISSMLLLFNFFYRWLFFSFLCSPLLRLFFSPLTLTSTKIGASSDHLNVGVSIYRCKRPMHDS